MAEFRIGALTAVQGNAESIRGVNVEAVAPSNGDALVYNATTQQWEPTPGGGGGGEVNTASNAGVSGIGLFDGKVGVDLEFRNLVSTNTAIGVALDAPNKEVELTFSAGNVQHQDLLGAGVATHAVIDAQLPTADQKAALVGTNGTPSAVNAYVTDSDPRLVGGGDEFVKVSVADTTAGYLGAKVTATAGLQEAILNPGANEELQLSPVYGSTGSTVCEGNDARLSDARTPTGAASGDLSYTYPGPTVIAATTGSGRLTYGAVADGQVLTRSGSAIIGTTPATGSDEFVKVTAADTTAGFLGAKVTAANGLQESVLNPGANEELQLSPVYGSTALTVCEGDDARLSDARTPTGAAGGDLALTYPNPEVVALTTTSGRFALGAVADGQVLTRSGTDFIGTTPTASDQLVKATAADTTADYLNNKVAAASGLQQVVLNPGLSETVQITPVYGSTVATVCEGNDARLSDARAPTGAASGQLGGTYPSPDVRGLREISGPTLLTMGGVADGQVLTRSGASIVGVTPVDNDELVGVTAADTTPGYLDTKIDAAAGLTATVLNPGGDERLELSPTYGSTALTVCEGDDARLSDARTPTGAASGDLSSTYPAPTVIAATTGSGRLTYGAVADGQVLTRSGTSIVGTTIASSDQLVKVTAADTTAGYLGAKITPANGLQENVLNPGANEELQLSPVYGAAAGTVCEGNDARLSDARAPTGAASGDLSSTYPAPTVIAATTGSGRFTYGTIADTQVLTRSGTTLVGTDPLVTSGAVPSVSTTATGSGGVAATASRSDHQHQVQTAAPTIGIGDGNKVGVSASLARADHDHAIREKGGPTDLTMGGVAQFGVFRRTFGTEIVGRVPWQSIIAEHFVSGNADTDEIGTQGWRINSGGGGSSVSITGDNGAPGILVLDAGTAGNGYAAANLGDTGFASIQLPGSTNYRLFARVRFRGSIGAGDFEAFRIGLMNNMSGDGPPSDGWGVKAEPGVSGNWILWARSGGTESVQIHPSQTVALNTWFTVMIEATQSSITGWINGVEFTSSVTTNIPTILLGPGIKNQSAGGAANIADTDYYFLEIA